MWLSLVQFKRERKTLSAPLFRLLHLIGIKDRPRQKAAITASTNRLERL